MFVFVDSRDQTSLSVEELSRLEAHRADPATATLSVVRVQSQALASGAPVRLNLDPGSTVLLDKIRIERRAGGGFSWFASTSHSADEALVQTGGRSFVSIRPSYRRIIHRFHKHSMEGLHTWALPALALGVESRARRDPDQQSR
jgi:hypothetical protein